MHIKFSLINREISLRLTKLQQLTGDERDRAVESLIDYIGGAVDNESNQLNRVELDNIRFLLQLSLDMKRADRTLEKKIDDIQPILNNTLDKIQKLEKRLDDIDKGK